MAQENKQSSLTHSLLLGPGADFPGTASCPSQPPGYMCLSHIQTCSIPAQLMFKDICPELHIHADVRAMSACSYTRAHTCTTRVICHHAHACTHTHTPGTQVGLPHCRRKGEGYEGATVRELPLFLSSTFKEIFAAGGRAKERKPPPPPRRETRMAMIPGVPWEGLKQTRR